MNVFTLYRALAWADAEPGTCVLISLREKLYFALVVILQEAKTLALISPRDWADQGGPTGIVGDQLAFGSPMWTIPGASIVAAEPAQIDMTSHNLAAGTLHQRPDGFVFVAKFNDKSTRHFNIMSGLQVSPTMDHALWFSEWSIVAPGTDGKQAVLHTVKV